MDHDPLAAAVRQLALAISELARTLGPETQRMPPAAQAALDITLRDSRRIAARLHRLDAQTDVVPPTK